MTARPLAGVTVVDLSRLLPGPLATRLLADLGARVVKVEEPRLGDPVREAPPGKSGRGALAAVLLGGVESVALDLKRPGAIAALGDLLATADVLVESFRPGTMARLGIAPAALRERFPRLVIASVSGWGQDGPYAARAGHDLTYQAVAGSLAPTGRMPAVPVADLVGAWSTVAAVLAALVARERTGQGTWIDAALGDAAVHANLMAWTAEIEGAKAVGERLALTGALPCYNLYRTADGHLVALAALEPHFWRRFVDAVGRPDLTDLGLSATEPARRAVAALIASRPLAEWVRLGREHDLPLEPVLAAGDAREHPQVATRGVLGVGPDGLPRVAFPVRFDGERPAAGGALAEVGEHTRTALAAAGSALAAAGRMALRRDGIGRRFSWRRAARRWFLR